MDPIANMLIKIKNAQAVFHETVDIPFSKVKFNLAKLLEKEKLVESIDAQGRKTRKIIRITLKYEKNKPFLSGLKRISKTSKRVYVKKKDLKSLVVRKSFIIISTSKGLMASEEALKKGLGGEFICEITQ